MFQFVMLLVIPPIVLVNESVCNHANSQLDTQATAIGHQFLAKELEKEERYLVFFWFCLFAGEFQLPQRQQPAYVSTQHNYFSQQDQRYVSTQNVEELEQVAVKKTQDTTSSIKNAIRIAKDTKGVATTTLKTLHHQGEQIRRTHHTAVRVDEELGRGEKLLGSLGGMFSMTWKPRKDHKICGPQVNTDQYKRKNHLGERDGLGLTGETPAARPQPQLSGTFSAQAQLVMQTKVQDEALTKLSHILNDLKGMTLEMGHEIQRQNGDLDRMQDDVDELTDRF
ncbi:unnamed protein product [Calypogeia fissa]